MARYQGPNYWLSNFYPALVYIYTVKGDAKIPCDNVESAYQALHANNDAERYKISQMHPHEAKKYVYSRQLPARLDAIKIMEKLLRQKFSRKRMKLRNDLKNAPDDMFIHENGWHDNFWGMCSCQGNRCLGKRKHNHLGRLLKKLKYQFIREDNALKEAEAKKAAEAQPALPVETETAPKETQVAETLEEQLKPPKKTKAKRAKKTTKKAKEA